MFSRYKYFTAKKTPSGIVTDGNAHCELGYKTANGGGEPCGVFAEWSWDGMELTARNDYSGYYPVFYYADGEQIMISSSIIKLIALGAPCDYNRQGLSVFCRCGFFLKEQTPFSRIFALPPNAALKWRPSQLSVSTEKKITPPVDISISEAVDGYIETFRGAMDRYQPFSDEFAIPLTGGRDSRQILLELYRRRRMPKLCISCGDARDITVAKTLAERLNIPHYFVKSHRPWMDYVWRKNIATHLSALEHSWIMCLADYLNANFNEIYEGTGVGIFCRTELLRPELVEHYRSGRYADVAQWLFDTVGPGEEFLGLLNGRFGFLGANRDTATGLVCEELKEHAGAANGLGSFNFWNWNRRATALMPFAMENNIARINTPFLDRQLYEFVSSIRPALIFQKEPQTQAILNAFPDFSDIPFYDELEKKEPPGNPFTRRCRNVFDRLYMIFKYNRTALPVILKMQKLRNSPDLTNRNKANQQAVLFYLSQLRYCSDRYRAEKILFEYDRAAKTLNSTAGKNQ